MRLSYPSILIVAVVLTVVVPASASKAADGYCGIGYTRMPTCSSGAVGMGEVQLRAETTTEGSPSDDVADHLGQASATAEPRVAKPAPPPPVPRGRLAADVDAPCQPSARLAGGGLCSDGQHAFLPPAKAPTKPADPAPVVAATPGVSLADVAQFVPRDASIRSQPNGWAIVGAPVNLFTDATTQVVGGTLLG
ncbi:MAG: hypothetical protein HDR73_10160, partial [Clavibacter sp.]|nr:hypothetical protein [Clavibacter sp.]